MVRKKRGKQIVRNKRGKQIGGFNLFKWINKRAVATAIHNTKRHEKLMDKWREQQRNKKAWEARQKAKKLKTQKK